MMNFPLRYIEKNVEDEYLVQGERLFEQNAVQSMQMVEKNLWIAKVDSFEVELKNTPTKLKAATCECDTFKSKGICSHIVASLFALRKELDKQKENKPKRKRAASSKRLTTRGILNQIEEEDLKRFVQEYAVKDRNFALALKARFIGQVDLTDDKGKYLQILEDTIKTARKKDRSISHRGTQKLQKIAGELMQQSELALAQSHYPSVVFIAQSFIEKFTPILRKINRSDEIRSYIDKSFKQLQQLLDKPIPPELLEDLWNYSITEFSKITYRINEIVPQFYRLQRALAEKLNYRKELLELLQEFSLQMQYSDENYTRLLIHKISLLEQLERWEDAENVVKEHLNNPQLLLFVIRQAMKKGDWQQAEYLINTSLSRSLSSHTRGQMEDLAIPIAQQSNNTTLLITSAENRLLKTYQIKYFELLKEHHPDDWNSKVEELLKQIQKAPYSLAQRDLIASIYSEEGYYDKLINYIQQLQSLDILQNFDSQLIKYDDKVIFELYEQLLSEYLKHHIGRKSAMRVRDKLMHLRNIGANKLVKKLVQQFRATYPERHALMEELELF